MKLGTSASTLRSLISRGGTVQVLNTWWAGLVAYLLGAIGVSVLAVQLFRLMVHAIVLAWPHLHGGPSKLSLIQQRRIDAALALPPSPTTSQVVAREVSTVPPGILAAQLDLSEKEDSAIGLAEVAAFELHSEPSSIAATKLRVAHSHPTYTRLTAGDIFNRSFGVITTASN
jgi:hypothetical protein